MEAKTKKRIKKIAISIAFLSFLLIILPYWLLPIIVNNVAKSAMTNAGLNNPQINTQHVTLFSTKISNVSFESNGITFLCPSLEASYSPITLLKKEIKTLNVAESTADLQKVLPPEAKAKLISSIVSLRINVTNNVSHYTGNINGRLLGGDYSTSLSFDIKNGNLIVDGEIHPKLKDDFPTPSFLLNLKADSCYSGSPSGSGEIIIPDTNLKLSSSMSIKDNIVNISTTLNSIVSKSDPYLERLFAHLDKQQHFDSFYGEVFSKFNVKFSTKTQLPAWDFVFRISDLNSTLALENNKELKINNAFASVHLSGLGEKWVLHSIPIFIKEIYIDQLKLSNGNFKILADEEQLLLSEGNIEAFGGKLSVYALYLNYNRLNAGFTIFVDDIQLTEIISALPSLSGSGTGSLHGKLPVSIYNGKKLKLHNAYLFSKPGVVGKLKLSDTTLLNEALINSGIPSQTCDNLSLALSDLDYSVIRLELIDNPNLEQSLQLQIEGKSVQEKGDIPVALNVRIHGSIESLLNIGLKSKGILK